MLLWNGVVGGAESVSVALAAQMRRRGAETTVVFVGDPEPLAGRLRASGTPYVTLGLGRGREVLRHPRELARMVSSVGVDGALLEERGLMAIALRAGGYGGPIVAVEHGSILLDDRGPTVRRGLRRLARGLGSPLVDAEVAVSDFMLGRMLGQAHAACSIRIYNGVDPSVYRPAESRRAGGRALVLGCASRLYPGKGIDTLIEAAAAIEWDGELELLVAGEGPEQPRLRALAAEHDSTVNVTFLGFVEDMASFWRRCDVAVIPSNEFVESFSMTTLEAMASGLPVIAARNGAIPELLLDGQTGALVTAGDVRELSRSIERYLLGPELRREHGLAARERAVRLFSLDATAGEYLDLFERLARRTAAARHGETVLAAEAL